MKPILIAFLLCSCGPQVQQEAPKTKPVKSESGVKFGPQGFGPRYNFSKGKFEFGPTLHFGPHYKF